MSEGPRMSYPFALRLAEHMCEILRPDCQRIEIAGSIRRKKSTIGDIELVVIPNTVTDIFGDPYYGDSLIYDALTREGFISEMNGPHHKQAHLPPIVNERPVNFDIYLTTPEQWGVIFLIRTGSADFSHWFVTHKCQGGALTDWMQIKDGRLLLAGNPVATPEETDVFERAGACWVPPEERER